MAKHCASRRRWQAAAAVTLAAVLLALAGCSSGSEQEQNAPKRALIKFVAAEYSSATKPILENLVHEFELSYPNIHVELQVVNWDILDGVYTNMLSKGQPPDLLNTNFYAHFAEDGLLNNMDELLSDSLKQKLYPYLLSKDRFHGNLFAIPYVSSVRNLYYNKELFEEAGIEAPPATWTELQRDATKIVKTNHVHGFGLDMTDNDIEAYLSYFFFGAGGGWIKDGNWAINSAENVKGLSFLKKLYDLGLTDSEPTVTTRDEKQRSLGDGGLGMMISGNYFTTVVPVEYPGLKWGTGPIPVKDGQPPMSFGVQDVLVSFKTDHTDKQALSIFLDFLYSDAKYEEIVVREGMLPVTSTIGGKLAETNMTMQHNLEQLEKAYFFPINKPVWSDVLDMCRKLGEAVLLGNYTPEVALDKLQSYAVAQEVANKVRRRDTK